MGCGKSSVGRELSKLLCCPFMDLDTEIETRSGCTVAEIFETSGEAEFRRLEKETLKDILETGGRVLEIPKTPALPTVGHPLAGGGMSSPSSGTPACKNQEHPSNERPQMILALGGGTVMTPRCAELVHENTFCIYLRASVQTLVSHLGNEAAGRPLLEASDLQERILKLMSQRSATYGKTAHVIIDTDGKSIETIASEIISLLRGKNHTL